MGVKGFLISCAMRRATSCHASVFWERSNSDKSSKTSTKPVFARRGDRKSTRLNSSHSQISYAVFCLKKKNFGNLAGRVDVWLAPLVFGLGFDQASTLGPVIISFPQHRLRCVCLGKRLPERVSGCCRE